MAIFMVIVITGLFLISIVLFITFIWGIANMDYLSPVWLLTSMISWLVGEIIFYKHTNKYPLNDISEYYTKSFKKLLIKKDNCFEIQFVKKNNIWVCENDSLLIKLNLNGYAFEKSYLISYVIRNLRYPLISRKRPFKCLFTNKFFIKKKLNIKLRIIDGDKVTEKIIVKNGVSKYGFIAKQITFSPFYLSALSNRHLQYIYKLKSYIDEKQYKYFYNPKGLANVNGETYTEERSSNKQEEDCIKPSATQIQHSLSFTYDYDDKN